MDKHLKIQKSKEKSIFFSIFVYLTAKTKAMKEIRLEIRIRSLQYDELTPQDRELTDKAKEATSRSYAPYSRFRAGAGAL